jgi:hypothetical protein
LGALTARQAHVERLGFELFFQFGIGQRLAAAGQRGFNGLLGQIDGGASGFLFLDRQLGHPLHQLGDAAGLAQKLRLGVFQISGRGSLRKTGLGSADQFLKGIGIVHKFSCTGRDAGEITKKGPEPFQAPALYWLRKQLLIQ